MQSPESTTSRTYGYAYIYIYIHNYVGARVDDESDALDGQRGLGEISREHNAPHAVGVGRDRCLGGGGGGGGAGR